MAAFSAADVDSIDFELLQHGATTLFRRPALFNAAADQLAGLTEALRFHENFRYAPWTGNLDALNDCVLTCRNPERHKVVPTNRDS